MAIHKSIPTKYGVDAIYWKIVSTTFDYRGGVLTVVLHGFKNQRASKSGCEPLSFAEVEYKGPEFLDLTRKEIYDSVRLEPEFMGSVLY